MNFFSSCDQSNNAHVCLICEHNLSDKDIMDEIISEEKEKQEKFYFLTSM